jgi:hypothetical protein
MIIQIGFRKYNLSKNFILFSPYNMGRREPPVKLAVGGRRLEVRKWDPAALG